MAYVASKQQTTTLFLSTIVTRTRKHTELTKKTDKPDGKSVLCQTKFSSVFRAVFYTVKLYSLTYGVWGPLHKVQALSLLPSPRSLFWEHQIFVLLSVTFLENLRGTGTILTWKDTNNRYWMETRHRTASKIHNFSWANRPWRRRHNDP
jgi:hypothetical protein